MWRLRLVLGTPVVLLAVALLYVGVLLGGEQLARIVHDAIAKRFQ